MNLEAIIIFLVSLFVYLSLEFLRSKLKIEELQEKSKKIVEKMKENPNLDDESLKELLEVQRKFYQYFMYSSLILLGVIMILKFAIHDKPIIKLPFKLPLLNKDWLGPLGTYILFYFLVSLLAGLLKKAYKSFLKEKANG